MDKLTKKITKRIEEIKIEREKLVGELQRQAQQALFPYDFLIAELEKLLSGATTNATENNDELVKSDK